MAHYYLGVLAVQEEGRDTGCYHWNATRASGLTIPRLEDNMGQAYHRRTEERLDSGDAGGALAAGMESLRSKPRDKRLSELIPHAHRWLAYEAASAGQWATAPDHREAADAAVQHDAAVAQLELAKAKVTRGEIAAAEAALDGATLCVPFDGLRGCVRGHD
jgi:hypothetical protein